MQPFNRTAKCVKCGYSVISNFYVGDKIAAGICLYEGDYDGTPFVLRACEDCQYRWKEAPLDVAPGTTTVTSNSVYCGVGHLTLNTLNGSTVFYFGNNRSSSHSLADVVRNDGSLDVLSCGLSGFTYGKCRIIIEQLPE